MARLSLKYYQELPDYISAEKIHDEFNELFNKIEQYNLSIYEVCNILYELADRQYHTYSLLNTETRNKIKVCMA